MKYPDSIENVIKNFCASKRSVVKTTQELDKRIIDASLLAQEKLKQTQSASIQPNIWRIIMKSRVTKLAAAAVIVLSVLIGIVTFNGTSAWAKVIKALEEVENVCAVVTRTMPDGTKIQRKWWLRKPHFLRKEEPSGVVIDNGKERLTIDKEKMQARLEDSWAEYRPVSQEYMFEQIGIFRGQKVEGLTVRKLDEQSNNNISVFHLDYASTYSCTYQGKAWVDTDTMLPKRITLQLTSKSKAGQPQSGEMIFDYAPISDDIFETVVPEGYTVLPRKKAGVISGKVVDFDGNPVQGAVVYIVDKWLRFLHKVETDQGGQFLFKLPPSDVHWVGLPIFLRAVPPNDTEHVAWTIIEDPKKKKDRGVIIPGHIGYIEVDHFLKTVNGIVLQMEQAGIISGLVTDMNGDPISDAEVVIEGQPSVRKRGMPIYPEFGFIGDPMGGDGPRGELTTSANEHGRYNVTNVPKFSNRARYKIRASAQGFATNGQNIDMTWKSGVEEVNIQLYRAGITVSGVLFDNYGEALERREIYGIVDGRSYCRTKTDEKGRFVLKDCPISPGLQIKAELSRNHWPPHEKGRYMSYRYHPDVVTAVDYKEGTTEYQVELTAERPEFTIEVELKNTAGEPLSHFPVEVRCEEGKTVIPSEWAANKKLEQRTNEQGYCKFIEVPNVDGLKLVMWGSGSVWYETLSKEQVGKIKKEYKKYKWMEVPIKVVAGQKEYKIEVTILTNEEYERKK